MTILFDVTRHFLNKGIGKIKQKSEEADQSLLNETRVRLFKQGRDTSVSKEKRQILANLLNKINQITESETDEYSFKLIDSVLMSASEELILICRKHNLNPSITEHDLSTLKERFFDEMNKMAITNIASRDGLEADPFQIKNRKNLTTFEAVVDEPLDVLLYYIARYQAEIIFDEHDSIIKHGTEYMGRKMAIIKSHILQYQECVNDIKPKHSELSKAKARLLKPHIELIQFKTQMLSAEYQYHLWGGSVITPYTDNLNHYMNQVLAQINTALFIEDVDDEIKPGDKSNAAVANKA